MLNRRRFIQHSSTALAGSNAATVDLDGRVGLPGFIEPHMQFALMAGLNWVMHTDASVSPLGTLADLVILEDDPRTVEPTAISDIRISETWMDGNRVFES